MSQSQVPTRILMFTSPDCAYCPSVEKLLQRTIGFGSVAFAHVSTIDINENPELKTRYKIKSLPTLIINDEKVLSGQITEGEVQNVLWNKLVTTILEREKSYDMRKETMLAITTNTLSSALELQLVRPSIGDYTHIGALQKTTFSILGLDVLATRLFYEAGKDLGLYGADSHLLLSLNPKIGAEIRSIEKRFKHVIDGIRIFFNRQTSNLPTYFSDRVDIVSLEDDEAVIRVYETASSTQAMDIGEPLCHFTAGEMAGMIEALLAESVTVRETACWGTGNPYCEFYIKLAGEKEKPYPLPKKRKDRPERFKQLIDRSMRLAYDSIFMKRKMRPNTGDYLHLGVLQQQLTSLKLSDPFTGSLLYAAGHQQGLNSPEIEFINRIKNKSAEIGDMEFLEALKVLRNFYNHPSSFLSREHGKVRSRNLRKESASLIIYELASATATPNAGVNFCDFETGKIAGLFERLTGQNIVANESKCWGLGNNFCEFDVSKVD
ncbi:V4R domain-containing protein [Candidatus Borrarchaeum sp.]|uniref:V4R domain-containing protein n=1 Tax=Candidatus Borrarchaeum sp. TaxID=2846742 RepID=UPI0025796787|nr:V4R domain-containing protein [Candidatus Borrarchaeum sp.]